MQCVCVCVQTLSIILVLLYAMKYGNVVDLDIPFVLLLLPPVLLHHVYNPILQSAFLFPRPEVSTRLPSNRRQCSV